MHTICLVEDEKNISNLVKTYLEKEGYKVITSYSGNDALKYIKEDVHLWILDIVLSDEISGYDVIKEIRKSNKVVPVIFTSARDRELDKIIGLELGSDDYITKPYSPKELMLRVNNMIKRVYGKVEPQTTYDPYRMDQDKRLVYEGDKLINLTTLEYDLLMVFVKNKDKLFSRDDLLNTVWGDDYFGSDRVVDDLIRRLRKKMPALNINTVYGYGYRLS